MILPSDLPPPVLPRHELILPCSAEFYSVERQLARAGLPRRFRRAVLCELERSGVVDRRTRRALRIIYIRARGGAPVQVLPEFLARHAETVGGTIITHSGLALTTSGARCLVFAFERGGNRTIDSITVDGVATTAVSAGAQSLFTAIRAFITNSGINAATGDVVVTHSGSVFASSVAVFAIPGYGSVLDHGAAMANGSNPDPATQSIDEVADGAVVAYFAMFDSDLTADQATIGFDLGVGTTTEYGQWDELSGEISHDAASKLCTANASGTTMSGAADDPADNQTAFAVVSLAPA